MGKNQENVNRNQEKENSLEIFIMIKKMEKGK